MKTLVGIQPELYYLAVGTPNGTTTKENNVVVSYKVFAYLVT